MKEDVKVEMHDSFIQFILSQDSQINLEGAEDKANRPPADGESFYGLSLHNGAGSNGSPKNQTMKLPHWITEVVGNAGACCVYSTPRAMKMRGYD